MSNKRLKSNKTIMNSEIQPLANRVCIAVQELNKSCERKGLQVLNDEKIISNLELVGTFFSVELLDALLLTPFISAKIIKNKSINRSDVLEWIRVDLHDALSLTSRLNKLCVNGILLKSYSDFSSNDGYKLSNKAYRCLLSNTSYSNKSQGIERNSLAFLDACHQLIDIADGEYFYFDALVDEIKQIIDEYDSIKQVKKLKRFKLNNMELMILIVGLYQQLLDGKNSIDIERITRSLNISLRSRMELNMSIMEGKSKLITHKLISNKNNMFKSLTEMTISEDFLNYYSEFHRNKGVQKPLKRGGLIAPNNIVKQKLFYNTLEQEEIDRLCKILDEKQYQTVINELTKQQLSSAITVLLYGKPGTGKTSTVLDIAEKTGRVVYKVDVETIKEAFVGESEKNLVEVFEEYKYLLTINEKHPILLLNEADGLLKNRITGDTNAVGEMLNTMTTLLLEKLENFNGILFATVNEPAFDSAFDRRFLIKTELKLPETATRINIIHNQFPELENSVLTAIAEQYPLTGGQISNIKRKLAMRKILDSTTDINACIIPLCEQEFVLQQSNIMKTISGFSLN